MHSTRFQIARRSALAIIAALLPAAPGLAQERTVVADVASTKGVVGGLKGGVILTSPRRGLPSSRPRASFAAA